jgi:hypothetical protein
MVAVVFQVVAQAKLVIAGHGQVVVRADLVLGQVEI